MNLSRRHFLRMSGAGLGAAAAAALPLPVLAEPLWEPPRASAAAGGPILLNSNENAYGPLPSVKARMAEAFADANRYPDPHYDELAALIAETHKVPPEQVRAACGSTEILKMCANAFCGHGEKLVMAQPTFEAIGHYAEGDGKVAHVALRADYAHDLEAMLAAMGAGPGLFYVCNPNNPTATLTPRTEIESFIQKMPANTAVLIDEAYHHFAAGAPGYESFLDRPVADDRVIVARTFSKVYGMAGLRAGYAVGTSKTIKQLDAEGVYDDVNCVAATCGVLSLRDTVGMHAAVRAIAQDRDEFVRQCRQRKLRYIPSFTNFVMVDCRRHVREVIQHFRARNIHVGRHFPPMDTWCRISLGLPEEMRAFWRAWDAMPPAPSA